MNLAARTNQTLYFARITLDQAELASNSQDKRRLEEAALSHLYGSIHAYLQELVRQYALAPFRDIDELLGRAGVPAELQELKILSEDASSWLSSLLTQYERLLHSGLDQELPNSNLITKQSDYVSLFRNILNDLEKVIQRMREHSQEY